MNANANNGRRFTNDEVRDLWVKLRDDIKSGWSIERAIPQLAGARLKQRGAILEACCPFHVEKTPSFRVNPERGTYRCFGVGCNAQGDVFTLVRDTQNLDFQNQMIFAADQAGIEVPDVLRKIAARRGAASKGQPARKIHRYPDSSPRVAPGHLTAAGLVVADATTRMPVAGRPFRMWNNGGQHGDKAFEERSYRPEMVHEYRSLDGELLMAILRVVGRDKKFFIPARLLPPSGPCPKALLEKQEHGGEQVAWVSVGPAVGDAKPVYGMEDVREWAAAGGKNIIWVEGEKTRDAAKRLLSGLPGTPWLVLTTMGGSKSAIYADWKPLVEVIAGLDRAVNFVTWPDADKLLERPDGTKEDRVESAVMQVLSAFRQRLIDENCTTPVITGRIAPPEGVESGWDLADAEKEGWSSERVMSWIRGNSSRVPDELLTLREEEPGNDGVAATKEAPETARPFDLAGDPARQQDHRDDTDWIEIMIAKNEMNDGLNFDDVEAPLTPEDVLPEPEPVLETDIVDPDDAGNDDVEDPRLVDPMHNPYFRCLGYLSGANYFMSVESGQIFELNASQMKPSSLLHLAPRDWWLETFPERANSQGVIKVSWEAAYSALIEATYRAGVWDPRLQCSQGARLDGRTVVFNTGSRLLVDGANIVPLHDFNGKNCYSVGPKARNPDVINPFTADSPEPRAYLDLIRKLDWREENRQLAIMALFGWIAIAPICGILKWRPHMWLDGPRGSGKSWVANNLVRPALGDYLVNVLANSSESGIRNMLSGRSVPVIFDEAEGDGRDDRARMDAIIRLARHSATESSSVVAQGVAGGGSQRYYSIASTFLMTSIVPQLEKAADNSRFARLKLASGRKHAAFAEEIERPAMELLTDEFCDRWIGRMVTRAKDYHKTYMLMVYALCERGLERRVADSYGTFATGCWLMLRDGHPEDLQEAITFISEEFNVVTELLEMNKEIVEDKDHTRIFQILMAHSVKLDGTGNSGARSEQLGTIVEIACGHTDPEDDILMDEKEARQILARLGMRAAVGDKPAEPGEIATTVLIHKKAAPISEILDKTPYARSYPDVMHQAEDVKMGKPVRFGAGFGTSRSIIVPLKHFSIGVNR